jgi:methanogen extracellular protein (TIGR04279 family)
MRLQGLLILLPLITSFLFAAAAVANPMDGILPEGTNLIKAPEMSISGPEANWTYPFSYYPIYAEGQTISGTYFGPERAGGGRAGVYISGFNISEFLNGSFVPSKAVTNEASVTLNRTGDAQFDIAGVQSGVYTLYIVDENSSAVLSQLPLLITSQSISIDSSSKVSAGEPLKVTVNTSGTGNLTRYYGAVMVSLKEYEGIRLNMTSSDGRNLNSTIELGNRSMQVQGLPSLSLAFVMKLLPMLPQDSAVGMQDSTKPGAEFYLITDPNWERGDYILTCVVYSPGMGILGMGQKEVEVV